MIWWISNRISLGAVWAAVMNPRSLFRLPTFLKQLMLYRKLERRVFGANSPLRIYPCLADSNRTQMVGHYFYQDC
jgi:hypothetical protein